MKIGLDVMGGDNAPQAIIDGAILASKELSSSDRIVLIGQETAICTYLKEKNVDPAVFDIVNAPDVIEMAEHPIKAITHKTESSIAIGFKLLKNNEIDSFASAGNSGAMLVGSIYSIQTIQGIIRPCTVGVIPKESGGWNVLIDIGTNADCKPDVLYQFAILGSLYAKYVHGINDPKVGLLNIGEEDEKGNLLCQSTFPLMKESEDFHFIGNIEGRDLFNDKADVIVCDGFTGNIVLKQAEAMYYIMKKRGLVDDYFKRFNYEYYGGSPILGVNGTVLVGHGISNDLAIKNMLLLSKNIHQAKLYQKIKTALEKFSEATK